MINEFQKEKFNNCIGKIYKTNNIKGIGTFQEKTLHKVIKNYYETNEENQEVKVNGYIADIFKNNQIIEIQTRAFNKLVPKLEKYLPDYQVNIIYPIAYQKYISWIDPNSGEEVSNRKSPKKGSFYDIILELYKIKKFLNNPNLKITLLYLNIKELRYLNGWSKDKKRGSSRCNQIPLELIDELELNDYSIFVPEKEKEFTSKEYAKTTKKTIHRAQVILNILCFLDVIEVVGKEKRMNIYKYKK